MHLCTTSSMGFFSSVKWEKESTYRTTQQMHTECICVMTTMTRDRHRVYSELFFFSGIYLNCGRLLISNSFACLSSSSSLLHFSSFFFVCRTMFHFCSGWCCCLLLVIFDVVFVYFGFYYLCKHVHQKRTRTPKQYREMFIVFHKCRVHICM